MAGRVDKTGTWDREKWVEAFAGSVRENSVEGKKSMRACDHQAMQNGLWGVVEAGKPPQPAYVMDIVRVFPPDQVFEACAG